MKMGYTLIVFGLLCALAGIVMVQKDKKSTKELTERTVPPSTPPSEKENTAAAPSGKSDVRTEAEQKGQDFENYVVHKFSKKYYTLKEWRSDKYSNGRYAEANTYPDMELTLHLGKNDYTFAVECKWRSSFRDNGSLTWADEAQIARYRKFAYKQLMPVFVVLGVGGEPSYPAQVYCVPLQALKYTEVRKDYLEKFKHDMSRDFFYEAKTEELR